MITDEKLKKEIKELGRLIDQRNKLWDKYKLMPIKTASQIIARNNVVRRINELDEKIKPTPQGFVLPS